MGRVLDYLPERERFTVAYCSGVVAGLVSYLTELQSLSVVYYVIDPLEGGHQLPLTLQIRDILEKLLSTVFNEFPISSILLLQTSIYPHFETKIWA